MADSGTKENSVKSKLELLWDDVKKYPRSPKHLSKLIVFAEKNVCHKIMFITNNLFIFQTFFNKMSYYLFIRKASVYKRIYLNIFCVFSHCAIFIGSNMPSLHLKILM